MEINLLTLTVLHYNVNLLDILVNLDAHVSITFCVVVFSFHLLFFFFLFHIIIVLCDLFLDKMYCK